MVYPWHLREVLQPHLGRCFGTVPAAAAAGDPMGSCRDAMGALMGVETYNMSIGYIMLLTYITYIYIWFMDVNVIVLNTPYIYIWVPIFKKHLQRFNVLLVGRWGKGLMPP